MAADSRYFVDGLGHLIHAIGVIADAQRSNSMTTLSDEVTDVATSDAPPDATEALVERLFQATIDFLEIASIHVGRKLGYYAELAGGEPATAADLARRTGTATRYAQEWLEQQATASFLATDDPEADAAERTYHLPKAHRPVLVDAEDPNLVAPLATLAVGVLRPLDALIEAYRRGSGVPFEVYGDDLVEGIGTINRPQFVNEMAGWLGSVPDVDARLRRQPPACVADVACGTAWSSISIARAYTDITVDALDIDEASIAAAQRNVSDVGLSDRIRTAVHDASAPELPGRYDLVTIFEALHDMNHPVEALRAMRASLTETGCVIVADEKVAERFTPNGDELERFNYCWSALHCLAVGLLDPDSAGTGTMLRPDTLRRYAADAGFTRVDVLPIENPFWRFYRLRP
ncbi:MAG TPA: methyltransferase domain-containing protein [Mycobacterium sp.]|nr:methyltransferase domain-containing protein [Mycobacterium sp.]